MTKRQRMRWTTAKTDYLVRNAGIESVDELADCLECTPEAVKQHAKRIRRAGQHVSLHRKPKGMRICHGCGKRRSLFASGGICRACELEGQLARIKERQASLMKIMPAEARARYAKTESRLASDPLPKPKPKRTAGMTPEERARAAEERERALEAWEIGCLNRRIKAAQKRKERMEKKCRGKSYDTFPDQKHKGGSANG